MKAAVYNQYGSAKVLQLKEVAKPIPGDNDVLIKIRAATVTMGDCELRNLTLPLWTRIPVRLYMGYRHPKNFIPGMEFSGVVESVGKDVKQFKKGDAVFGSSGMKMGACAEYICQPANSAIALKPDSVSFEAAATIIVGGVNAWHFLKKGNISPGKKVLINGAAGSIGTYGVQLAKFLGAEVTAVDSTPKMDMLKSIGADHVIDYTREDFSESGVKYDVVLDMVYKSSFSKCIASLKDDGCYLMANTGPLRMLRGVWISKTSRKKAIFALAGERVEDLNYLADLIRSGAISPVIDKRYPLEQITEAHDYVEKGYKKGHVIILVSDEDRETKTL